MPTLPHFEFVKEFLLWDSQCAIPALHGFFGDLYLPMSDQFAESTWTAMGVVNRRGQQKTQSCEPSCAIQSEHSKFFTGLVVLMDCSETELSRSGNFCVDRQ